MGVISKLAPLNLAAEHEAFFKDFSYNPQFVYAEQVAPTVLEKWGKPKPHFVEYAKQVIQHIADVTITRIGYDNDVIAARCRALLATIGVTEPINIQFLPQKVTRCSIIQNTIVFQDRPQFSSEAELEGTLNHEVQTHLLRNLNQKKQQWQLDREHFDAQILRTEEGLAVLHSAFSQPTQRLWRSCAYYLAVALSLTLSFAEAFSILRSYGLDAEFAWRLCLRTKRGLTDTSLPGANTKDLCYLEGLYAVWEWVMQGNDPRDLYLGKVFLEELAVKKTMVTTTQVYYPSFLQDVGAYRSMIQVIGETNNFATFLQKGTYE